MTDMRVQFTYTQEDLVDAAQRFSNRSRVLRSFRWREALASAVGGWIVMFALTYRAGFKGVLLATLTAVVAALLSLLMRQRTIKKRLRRVYHERWGEKNDFSCEVELTPSELLIRNQEPNVQGVTKWESVEEISASADSIAIFARNDGGVIVRNNAFRSADERQRFVDLARNYMEAAHQNKSNTQ
ncbi:MAG TPA: YcxB family protein [Pyrinomonadaceae bacterium]|nr:YcxB family protein [Pyrinomonadaceae bacterium]